MHKQTLVFIPVLQRLCCSFSGIATFNASRQMSCMAAWRVCHHCFCPLSHPCESWHVTSAAVRGQCRVQSLGPQAEANQKNARVARFDPAS